MVVRVVVGGTPIGRRLSRQLANWSGQLSVLVEDGIAAERLREEGVPAVRGNLTDPDALRSMAHKPDIAIVAIDCGGDARDRIEATRDAFPEAYLVLIGERIPSYLEPLADQCIALDDLGGREIVDAIIEPNFTQTIGLLRTMKALKSPVAIVMHDNPDPDAIAAALGVRRLLEAVGRSGDPLYAGEITHQENRAFVNLLELELLTYDDETDLDTYGGIILVDHSNPGVNDQLPDDLTVDIIIDHHTAREEAQATFVDRRHDVGATSTLVAEHLLRAQLTPDITLATALWYGIQVDTDGFRRGVTRLDFTIAAKLRPHVDTDTLRRIESPRMTGRTLDTIATAIVNREVVGDVLISDLGSIQDRDALAQAADELLQMAGVSTVCVFGTLDDVIIASARNRSQVLNIGDAVRYAFDQIGSAGGHEDMAGAQITLRELRDISREADETYQREMVKDRFLEGIEMASRQLPSGYHDIP